MTHLALKLKTQLSKKK